jgi:hypothetical protein
MAKDQAAEANAKTAAKTKPAKKNGAVETVRRPKVNAGPCPKSELHTATRIYRTAGTTRYAVCDECGETWKVIGERADADKQYLAELADALDGAQPVSKDGEELICLDVKLRKEIVIRLREIAGR